MALIVGLRRSLQSHRFIVAFAPLAVVGSYYAGSSSWHLMQVEELVGFPLFCCAWSLDEALRRGSRRLAFVAGVCGGIVLAFKLIFAIVVVALAAAVVSQHARVKRYALGEFGLLWLGGLLVPVVAVAVYAIGHATQRITLVTTFVIPLEILATIDMHAPIARLADSATRFALYYRGLILLGLIGIVTIGRGSARAMAWRAVCLAWLAADAIVIGAQLSSWWQYHFLLFVPPLGILATFGLAFLVRNGVRSRRRAVASLALTGIVAYVAVPLPQGAIGTILEVVRARPFASVRELERYREDTSSEFADAEADARFTAQRAPSSMYVFGDPLIYLDSKTTQAIAMNSWAIQLFTPALWRRTVAELCSARPKYVFVYARFAGRLTTSDGGAAMSLLDREYVPAAASRNGEWYVARATGSSACGIQANDGHR